MAGVLSCMMGRDQKIYEEAAALWRELFDESPPKRVDGGALLEVIMGRLPERRYDHLTSPHLRPSQIRGPRRLSS